MTFDAQRPVMAHGHPQRSRCVVPVRLGDGRDSFGSAADASRLGRCVPWCPGQQKRMAAVAGASVLRRVGAVR
jgi:hypothetical protein